jgi:hypothetical protein
MTQTTFKIPYTSEVLQRISEHIDGMIAEEIINMQLILAAMLVAGSMCLMFMALPLRLSAKRASATAYAANIADADSVGVGRSIIAGILCLVSIGLFFWGNYIALEVFLSPNSVVIREMDRLSLRQ